MAIDPISAISGPLDSASFDDDADAYGSKVLAEITQLINKVNELVTGVTDTNAETVLNTTANGVLAEDIEDLEAADVVLAAADADMAADIVDLQAASLGGTLDTQGDVTLSTAQCIANRVINVRSEGGASAYIQLPSDSAQTALTGCLPLTVINNQHSTAVSVRVQNDRWGDAGVHQDGELLLEEGAAVTMVPLDQGDGANAYWYIVSTSQTGASTTDYDTITQVP